LSLDISKYREAFVSESKENLLALNTALIELEKKPGAIHQVEEMLRAAHNLKSMSATMGHNKMAALCHGIEDILDPLRKQRKSVKPEIVDVLFECFDALAFSITRVSSNEEEADNDRLISKLKQLASVTEGKPALEVVASESSSPLETQPPLEEIREIKVKVEILDTLMNLTEELLVIKMNLDQLYASDRIGEMSGSLDALGRLLSDLQYNVMQARLIPVGQVFQRFPRIVRDLARKEKKNVNLVIEGGEMEIDRKILDKLAEPLAHLLRNAVDHGIEALEERKRLKKPSTGTVKMSCREEKGYAIVEVEDDGKGFSIEEIKDVAVKKGIVSRAEVSRLSHDEAVSLLFDSGFTTAKIITDVSGRGVGLNIVKRTVESLGGRVTIAGAPGKGLKVSMRFPLTLSIISSLLIEVGDEIYAVPLNSVVRSVRVKDHEIKKMLNQEVVVLPDGNIILLRLGDIFHITQKGSDETLMVIVGRGDEFIGLGVDAILDKQDIIVKPLNELLRWGGFFSGLTILGDGRPVLILDVNYFFEGVLTESLLPL